MALTFPGSPAVDDQTTTGGRTYRWTGYAWDLVGSGIAGPTGASVTGPTGEASTVTGPSGDTGPTGGGGDSSDKLPLAGGTMTGAILFGTGGQNINVGSFDNGTGGSNGISLSCAVGYELNWQGGHISNTYSSTNYAILCDSSLTLAAGKRLTFGDSTYLDSKLPVVVDMGTGSGSMPTDAAACDVVDCTFNGTAEIANPTNAADGQTILWRITRTAAEVVTLGNAFTIVSGSINDTTNYRTFVRATYSAAETKWFAEVTNVEVIPPAVADVALLLHMDGADTSTVFTDSSSHGLTVTPYGSAQISTAQSVFGGASALLNGSSDYLETTFPDVDWSVDFTVECWLRQTTGGGYQAVFSAGDLQSGVGGINCYVAPSGSIDINNGFAGNISGGSVVPGVWTHLAIVQISGTSYAYQDGVAIGSGATNYPVQTGVVRVGANPNYGQYFSGHVEELRVVKGVGIYTGAFSVPAVPLTDPV